MLAVKAEDALAILAALESAGIAAARMGRVIEQERGIVLREETGERPWPRFERDEIARLFS